MAAGSRRNSVPALLLSTLNKKCGGYCSKGVKCNGDDVDGGGKQTNSETAIDVMHYIFRLCFFSVEFLKSNILVTK